MIFRFIKLALFSLGISYLMASAHAETIRRVTLASTNWEPHYGEKLLNQGYYSEITREAFMRAGYDLHIVFVPWKRALKHAELGRYDGLLGAYLVAERQEKFIYSEPVSTAQSVLFSLKESNITYTTLRDLIPYKIGIMRGTSGGPAFDAATYLQKVPVDNQEINLDKLLNRRIDMIYTARRHAIHTLNARAPNWQSIVTIHEPAIQENIVYNTISKMLTNPQEIIDAFNLGLNEIKADGTYDKILEKHGFN